SFGWNAGYAQNNGPELSSDLSLRAINNQQSMRMNWDLPFDRLGTVAGAPRDSAHMGGPAAWRRLLGRLGTISADAKFDQLSSYTRVTGTPSFVYLFGFSPDPGTHPDGTGRVSTQFGNSTTKNENWSAGARTRVNLFWGATVSTVGDVQARHSLTNGVITRSSSTHFPSLEFEYGQVAHALRLDTFLRNAPLRTSYDRSRRTDSFLH